MTLWLRGDPDKVRLAHEYAKLNGLTIVLYSEEKLTDPELASLASYTNDDYKDSRLQVKFEEKSVYVDGTEVHLSPNEFRILSKLVRTDGVVTRDRLLEELDVDYAIGPRSVDVHLCRIKRKLGDSLLIRPVIGVGYRFIRPDSQQE